MLMGLGKPKTADDRVSRGGPAEPGAAASRSPAARTGRRRAGHRHSQRALRGRRAGGRRAASSRSRCAQYLAYVVPRAALGALPVAGAAAVVQAGHCRSRRSPAWPRPARRWCVLFGLTWVFFVYRNDPYVDLRGQLVRLPRVEPGMSQGVRLPLRSASSRRARPCRHRLRPLTIDVEPEPRSRAG